MSQKVRLACVFVEFKSTKCVNNHLHAPMSVVETDLCCVCIRMVMCYSRSLRYAGGGVPGFLNGGFALNTSSSPLSWTALPPAPVGGRQEVSATVGSRCLHLCARIRVNSSDFQITMQLIYPRTPLRPIKFCLFVHPATRTGVRKHT